MSEIVTNPEDYFSSLIPSRSALLVEMEQEAQLEEIPIVGPVVAELLAILVTLSDSRQILELGTATGYSTLYMAEALPGEGSRLITIDNDPQMAARAKNRFRQAQLAERIELRIGDAVEIMQAIHHPFDMIFLDIEKEDYIKVLPHCERLLNRGGLLVADNVAFRDADAFNQQIHFSDRWRVVNLFAFLPQHSPQRDALCIALRC